MALVTILLLLFFILGVAFGPLLLGGLIAAFDDRRSHRLSAFAIGLGLKSIWKPAITFTTSDELTLKRRQFDEKHDKEYIKFGGVLGGVKRHLFDPRDRLHSFYGTPFGFVDELFGVVIDPRDAALGEELRKQQANAQYEHRVEKNNQLHEAVKAVFETPRGHVGVRLPTVVSLFGGSFDSQIVKRIRGLYETSQAPKSDTSALTQLLVPVGAFIGVVLLGMFAAGQTGGGGGAAASSGSGNTSIGVGAQLLFVASLTSIRDGNWRDRFVGIGVVGLVGVVAAVLLLAFPTPASPLGIRLPLGLWALIMMGLGLLVPPFVASFFGRSLGALGMGLGKLYITLGLLGYDRPVITLDEGEYRVVEYDEGEWEKEPKWYRFAMTRIGIDFNNTEDAWPDGTTVHTAEVQAMADGGSEVNAPSDHAITDLIAVDDIKGFVPTDPEQDAVHVRTDRTTGWFLEAGQDRRLMMAALQWAKQDFGGGQKPVGDKWILASTLAAMAMGAIFDVVVFF